MTIDEFFSELSQVKDNFIVTLLSGVIRLRCKKGVCHCPLTAVSLAKGREFPLDKYCEAGDFLGLSINDSILIVYNADNSPTPKYRNIRERLLSCLGLS